MEELSIRVGCDSVEEFSMATHRVGNCFLHSVLDHFAIPKVFFSIAYYLFFFGGSPNTRPIFIG